MKDKNDSFHCIKELGDGDCFGEMAIISGGTRAARIRTHTDCHFAVLTAEQYRSILQKQQEKLLKRDMSFLWTVEILKGFGV